MPARLFDLDFFQQHINSAIAQLLISDPANAGYLEPLNNSLIALDILNPDLQLYIAFEETQIQLRPLREDDHPHLRIKGKALDLAKLLGTPIDSASSLRQLGIEVSGDVGLLLEISQLASRIEIDWEYLLSEKLGELPAVLISKTARAAQAQAKKVRQDLSRLIQQQLNERSNLPTRPELEEARRELREIGYRLDRLDLALKQRKN